jgi:DNA-binding HxlR family transcriptional regulator
MRNRPPVAVLPSTASASAERCSVLGALTLVGDFWTLGVVRSVIHGLSRFGAIQRELGIATNVLTDRLNRLVDVGVLERVSRGPYGARHEYALSAAGRDLAPVLLALKAWGDRHVQPEGPWMMWRHGGCASPAAVEVRCPDCGAALELSQLESVSLREAPEDA